MHGNDITFLSLGAGIGTGAATGGGEEDDSGEQRNSSHVSHSRNRPATASAVNPNSSAIRAAGADAPK